MLTLLSAEHSPKSLEQEIFQQALDVGNHFGFHHTYDRIANPVYMKQLIMRLRKYISHCPEFQFIQIKRHASYGSLHGTHNIPFYPISPCSDFIVKDGFNSLATLTCPYNKKFRQRIHTRGVKKFNRRWFAENSLSNRRLLFSHPPPLDTYGTAEWANIMIFGLVCRGWGILKMIISDRDAKFMPTFWKAVFNKLGVKLLTTTAYHPQSDVRSGPTKL